MSYAETETFRSLRAPMDAEIELVQEQLIQLARTIDTKKLANKGKPKSKQRPTKSDENKVVSLEKKMQTMWNRRDGLHKLSTTDFSWPQLRDILVEAEKHTWNARQRALGNKQRQDYEGKFEDSYRDYKGWPLGASMNTTDFPDGSEGKYLNGPEATFRVGKVGKRAFGVLLRSIAREFLETAMTSEQWDTLFDGEVSAGKLYETFPNAIRVRMQHDLSPQRVLSQYPQLVFLTNVGFFCVPREDYEKALSLASVSQMSPKYRLKRRYIESRILATEQQANVTTKKPLTLH